MTMGKVLKLKKKLVVVVVVVVQSHTHNSLTAISTKLCEYIDFHMEMCIGIVVLVKQQQTALGNTL